MDSLAEFVRDHYLKLEEREAEPLEYGSGFSVARHLDNSAKLERERQERYIKATRREIERRGLSVPRFLQPFEGAVILRDGEAWHGRFWCGGTFYRDEGSWARAVRLEIERAHAEALREDAYRLRRLVEHAHREALVEDMERETLARSLRASVRRPRFDVTDLGRQALADIGDGRVA